MRDDKDRVFVWLMEITSVPPATPARYNIRVFYHRKLALDYACKWVRYHSQLNGIRPNPSLDDWDGLADYAKDHRLSIQTVFRCKFTCVQLCEDTDVFNAVQH